MKYLVLLVSLCSVFTSCATLNGEVYSMGGAEDEYHRLYAEKVDLEEESLMYSKRLSFAEMAKETSDRKLVFSVQRLDSLRFQHSEALSNNSRLESDILLLSKVNDSLVQVLDSIRGYKSVIVEDDSVMHITGDIDILSSKDSISLEVCSEHTGKVSVNHNGDYGYGRYVFFCSSGKREWFASTYHKNGNLASDELYINGELEGEIKYYANGNLRSKETYKNGVIDGVSKWYYENGNLQWETHYRNGKREGVSKWYYENGNLQWETHYRNDKREGVQLRFKSDGSLSWKVPYKRGKIGNSIVTSFEQHGKILYKSVLGSDGVCIGKMKFVLDKELEGIVNQLEPVYARALNKWITHYTGTPQGDITKCADHYIQ